jgi:uncharacterized protein YjlB
VVGLEPDTIGLADASVVAWAEGIQILGIVSGDALIIPAGTP